MNGRKPLSPEEIDRIMLQAAAAADVARITGLVLSADLAEIRAGQAGIETARLRHKLGKDAIAAGLPQKSAAVRAERAEAARKIGAAMQSELRKSLAELTGAKPTPKPVPPDGAAEDFIIEGRVLKGSDGVAGVVVDAVTTTKPASTVAQTTSGASGAFRMAIENVAQLRKKLELDEGAGLAVIVAARSGREVLAQAEGDTAVKAGGRATVTLQTAAPSPKPRSARKPGPSPRGRES